MILDKEQLNISSDKQTIQMLYERQKQTLDSFLERKAISQEQYDTSLKVLKEKMKI